MHRHDPEAVAAADDGLGRRFRPPGLHRALAAREDCGGNWYKEKTTGMEGWLCPALFHYFDVAPRRLYLAIGPKYSPV
jgi:hypothetical protein